MSSSLWYKRVGFYNNPFSIKPAAYHDNMIGLENTVDDVSYAILTKKLVFVEGEYGQGKTTLLKKLINDFGGKKQVAYFSCNRLDGRLNIERLLKKRYGFLGRLFDLEAKDVVLLLDEAQHLGEEDYKQLGEHHKKGSFKSIVFVSPKLNGKANGLRTNALVVDLKKTDNSEAVKIIRQRVGHLHLLPDDMINRIFELSNFNVRGLLKNCETVCRYAVDNEMTKVTEDLVEELLGKGVGPEKTGKPTVKKVKSVKKEKKAKDVEEGSEDDDDEEGDEEDEEQAGEFNDLAEMKKGAPKKEEAPEVVVVGEMPQKEEPLKPQMPEEEEDEIDRQVKQLAMQEDDDSDEVHEPKKKKKAVPAAKLDMPEEEALSEEDYY